MQPDDESKRIKERERGLLAQQIYANPLWDEAYEALAKGLMSDIMDPALDSDATMERKRHLLALYGVKRYLARILETGNLASIQLEEARDG